ncbi:MAG: hypothetical protein AAGA03_01110 [Planctomycetota bacterium]
MDTFGTPMRRWGTGLATCIGLITFVGCTELETSYGRSSGRQARASVNGFSALRNTYTNAGFKTKDVYRLTERTKENDVIVWTPRTMRTITPKVSRWLERWLRQGDRTLVYVLPDSGCEAEYWESMKSSADPDQRLEYRRRRARAINQQMAWRLNRVAVPTNGWFQVTPLQKRVPIEQVAGRWAETEVAGVADPDDRDQGSPLESLGWLEHAIKVPDEEPDDGTAAAAAAPGFTSGATGPGSSDWSMLEETTRSRTPTVFRGLLTRGGEQTIIGEVRSDRWNDSRILVIAGGSLLTNYAFTREPNRKLAERLVREGIPTDSQEYRAGFLSSGDSAIPVSEKSKRLPTAAGMELLTTWPLSLVTMHGTFLGLVTCLALMPIFGRRRKLTARNENDFGHHLDAVAALMTRAGGEDYARARISEYLRRVRGDETGEWLLPEAHPVDASSATMAKPDMKRLGATENVNADSSASGEQPPSAPVSTP